MKVSELTGAKLDYWVAKAEGLEAQLLYRETQCWAMRLSEEIRYSVRYLPTTNWAQGGPIIEREKIRWQPLPDEGKVFCWTHITKEMDPINGMRGDTILQAAMRCFVASKFGEDVTDE